MNTNLSPQRRRSAGAAPAGVVGDFAGADGDFPSFELLEVVGIHMFGIVIERWLLPEMRNVFEKAQHGCAVGRGAVAEQFGGEDVVRAKTAEHRRNGYAACRLQIGAGGGKVPFAQSDAAEQCVGGKYNVAVTTIVGGGQVGDHLVGQGADLGEISRSRFHQHRAQRQLYPGLLQGQFCGVGAATLDGGGEDLVGRSQRGDMFGCHLPPFRLGQVAEVITDAGELHGEIGRPRTSRVPGERGQQERTIRFVRGKVEGLIALPFCHEGGELGSIHGGQGIIGCQQRRTDEETAQHSQREDVIHRSHYAPVVPEYKIEKPLLTLTETMSGLIPEGLRTATMNDPRPIATGIVGAMAWQTEVSMQPVAFMGALKPKRHQDCQFCPDGNKGNKHEGRGHAQGFEIGGRRQDEDGEERGRQRHKSAAQNPRPAVRTADQTGDYHHHIADEQRQESVIIDGFEGIQHTTKLGPNISGAS